MKTTYWLVAAAAVAAGGVTVYARLTASDPPVPKVPLATEAPVDEAPRVKLPPIVIPPDEPLALPDVEGKPVSNEPMPIAVMMPGTLPVPPVAPASASEPVVPPVPPVEPVVPTAPPVIPPSATAEPPVAAPVIPPAVPSVPAPPTLPKAPDPLPVPKPQSTEPPISARPKATDAIPPVAIPTPPPAVTPPAVTPPPVTPAPVNQPAVASPSLLPPPKPAPAAPPVLQPPVAPTPAKLPQPRLHSDSMPDVQPEAQTIAGKFVVLTDDKLIEGNSVSLRGDTVLVRQGVLDRPFPKSQVQFVAASKDDVYKFMLAKVPATDVAARLKLAKWCMFCGMREQALTEAREVQKLQPTNRGAADLIRSLELSLKQFPPANPPKMTPPEVPVFPTELRSAPVPPIPPAGEAEPDVTPEAALVFGSRVQPFLANQCVSCHAKPSYAGTFKLARVTPTSAGTQGTRANLRAVAGQLKKDNPAASPLLLKALSAHGGMKLPAVESRHAAAYQMLEAWTALAVGTPVAAPATAPATQTPPAPSAPPEADPLVPPALPVSPAVKPPVADPLPPVPPPVKVPSVDPLPPVAAPPTAPSDPLLPPLPPATPAPAPLPKPVAPKPVAPVTLPRPDDLGPILPPAPPVTPPAIPPADARPKPPAQVIPPIPPATAAPKPPSPVKPASGSQFGAAQPPKPPVTGPSGDEFDPAGFNQQPRK